MFEINALMFVSATEPKKSNTPDKPTKIATDGAAQSVMDGTFRESAAEIEKIAIHRTIQTAYNNAMAEAMAKLESPPHGKADTLSEFSSKPDLRKLEIDIDNRLRKTVTESARHGIADRISDVTNLGFEANYQDMMEAFKNNTAKAINDKEQTNSVQDFIATLKREIGESLIEEPQVVANIHPASDYSNVGYAISEGVDRLLGSYTNGQKQIRGSKFDIN
jgi:hypothetical protein